MFARGMDKFDVLAVEEEDEGLQHLQPFVEAIAEFHK